MFHFTKLPSLGSNLRSSCFSLPECWACATQVWFKGPHLCRLCGWEKVSRSFFEPLRGKLKYVMGLKYVTRAWSNDPWGFEARPLPGYQVSSFLSYRLREERGREGVAEQLSLTGLFSSLLHLTCQDGKSGHGGSRAAPQPHHPLALLLTATSPCACSGPVPGRLPQTPSTEPCTSKVPL